MNTLFNTMFENEEASHYQNGVYLRPRTYDLQESNVQLKLTVVDTVGFGDQINKEDRWGWWGEKPLQNLGKCLCSATCSSMRASQVFFPRFIFHPNPWFCLQDERRSLASFLIQMEETDSSWASGFPLRYGSLCKMEIIRGGTELKRK